MFLSIKLEKKECHSSELKMRLKSICTYGYDQTGTTTSSVVASSRRWQLTTWNVANTS